MIKLINYNTEFERGDIVYYLGKGLPNDVPLVVHTADYHKDHNGLDRLWISIRLAKAQKPISDPKKGIMLFDPRYFIGRIDYMKLELIIFKIETFINTEKKDGKN